VKVRILLALCAVVFPAFAWAQGGTAKEGSQTALKTFVSPDGSFRFTYAAFLIRCELQQQAGGYVWAGDKCSAYHPVCDGETGPGITPIACIAYPRNKFTDTDAFEAATFSVETVNGINTAEKCVADPVEGLSERRGTLDIYGVSFTVFEFGEAGMNQAVTGHIYRTFRGGKCYQLGINAASATAEVFDPPARKLSKADWQEINGRLEQARDSFEFLK